MTGVVFIGDELTATGYRLAGAEAVIVPPAEAAAALAGAREHAALVLLVAGHAAAVPAAELDAALSTGWPLTLVVDDILERGAPPDIDALMRRALGVEAA